jgi:hypothetical protein
VNFVVEDDSRMLKELCGMLQNAAEFCVDVVTT